MMIPIYVYTQVCKLLDESVLVGEIVFDECLTDTAMEGYLTSTRR